MQHHLDVVLKMMTYLMDGKKDPSDGTMEQARPSTAPIDFADWLKVIEPAMQDLSDSDGSHLRWQKGHDGG